MRSFVLLALFWAHDHFHSHLSADGEDGHGVGGVKIELLTDHIQASVTYSISKCCTCPLAWVAVVLNVLPKPLGCNSPQTRSCQGT